MLGCPDRRYRPLRIHCGGCMLSSGGIL